MSGHGDVCPECWGDNKPEQGGCHVCAPTPPPKPSEPTAESVATNLVFAIKAGAMIEEDVALALKEYAAAAVERAVAEEREACAQEAEQQACATGLLIHEGDPPHELSCAFCRQSIRIAIAVRARGGSR